MKIKNKILTFFLLSIFWFINIVNADGIDVEANLPSGTYDKVLKIRLTSTDPKAKTFYSFNPNGGPNDALLYTSEILLKSSTPLVFFSIVNTKVESKIKINSYTINYPNTINLTGESLYYDGKIHDLSIKNNSQKDIDISFWELRKDGKVHTFPDGTIIKTQESLDVSNIYNSTGTITLFSPNSESKDFMNIKEKIIEKVIPTASITKTETASVKPKTDPVSNNTEEKIEEIPNNTNPTNENQNPEVNNEIITPSETNNISYQEDKGQENIDNTEKDLKDNLKTSLNESGKSYNSGFIIFFIIIIMSLAGFLAQYYIVKKKKA